MQHELKVVADAETVILGFQSSTQAEEWRKVWTSLNTDLHLTSSCNETQVVTLLLIVMYISVMTYWKRQNVGQDLVLCIDCWLDVEMWVLYSKAEADERDRKTF